MDAVSGIFLNALGTDMLAMEEYFPFVRTAFSVMQYIAWTILFLITIWQLFRSFGGPITEAENPWTLLIRSALFALLIGFAKPIFLYVLEIAKAPYTALMNLPNGPETFTFVGIEYILKNGVINLLSAITVVGEILVLILMIALGWNYFKLLLEVVERYVVVGVLCYTSPLAYSMGASKSTNQVFKSWCRMVGSQLLLLVMNVWFLRAFNSSVGHYVGAGGALTNGHGSVFLWLFCALAFLKTAQRFDAYLASIGLNVAQTGSGLGFELLMAARLVTGAVGGFSRAGNVFGHGGAGAAATAGVAAGGFMSKFKGNSFVRDSVVQGGQRMGAGGAIGLVGRAFGGIAAKNGASLTGESIASVARRTPNVSGTIGGDIANRSLGNYMPHLNGKSLANTQITGGKISTDAIGADGKKAALSMYSADQFEKPTQAHTIVTASDGSKWFQMASGEGAGEYYSAGISGVMDTNSTSTLFPGVEHGTTLRSVDDGVLEATTPNGNALWYNSAYYEEPNAPHSTIYTADGVGWYAMNPNTEMPNFEFNADSGEYNISQFRNFMPGYEAEITSVSDSSEGRFEVRHEDGSGTRFYDSNQYDTPRGDYTTYEDSSGHSWYAVNGTPTVERRPVYENGEPVYNGDNIRTVNVESMKYRGEPSRFSGPRERTENTGREPRRKN